MDSPFQGWDWVEGSGMVITLPEETISGGTVYRLPSLGANRAQAQGVPHGSTRILGQVVKDCLSYSGAKETEVTKISKQRSQSRPEVLRRALNDTWLTYR